MKRTKLANLLLTLAAVLSLAVFALPIRSAFASSHREAPSISEDPTADNTDVYAFVSPDNAGTVTLIADFIPLQQPAAGPNFYRFSDNVVYEINVDNVGDARTHHIPVRLQHSYT